MRSPCARLTSRMMPNDQRQPGREQRVEPAEQDALEERVDPARASPHVRNRRAWICVAASASLRPAGERRPGLPGSSRRDRRHRSAWTMSCSTSTTLVPSRLMRRQRVVDVADDDRREAEAELVAEQQPRVGHQRAADRDHLLLAAGERRRRRVAPLGEHRETARRRGRGVHGPRRAGRRRRSAGSPRPTATETAAGLPAPGRCRACTISTPGSAADRRARRTGPAAAGRGSRPAIAFSKVDLARPVGADDGDRLALARARRSMPNSAWKSP